MHNESALHQGFEIEIQPLSAAHYADWLVLWKAYQSFYNANSPDDVTRKSFSRMLDAREPTYGSVAMDGEQILGFVHWILHRSNWTEGDYCYLQDLYVDEGSRGLGLGRLLIEHVYSEAKLAGCSRVYWLTQESNATAIRLYERVAERTGFIHYKKSL